MMKSALSQGPVLANAISLLSCLCVLMSTLPAVGNEYFVSKQGSDADNGTSREAAFLTIQKGVDALKPGDTLTIGPGEYSENVARANLGNMRADTVISADIPRTVVLRGDVAAPEFKKVKGYRFVYAAPFAQEPQAVLEHAAMKILLKKPNVSELEFEPGSIFYDTAKKMLYISSAGQEPPAGRRYTIAVSGRSGLELDKPRRVVIEGITATGFYRTLARRPGFWVEDYQWGIALDHPTSCTVRDCCTFLNCGGITLNNGRGNVVERCLAHDNPEHNIQYFGGPNHANNVARNCGAYRGAWGIDSYTTFAGPMLLENNIAWGHFMDYSTKGTGSDRFASMEGCVALNDIRIHHLENCIFAGRSNEYGRDGKYTRDNIIFSQEKDLDVQLEFADPLNMDWRLQGDSRFRGAREDGKDRGVYPDHDYTIYFLSPEGDDKNEGTSVRRAWKTLGRAMKDLEPGCTLYLTEGMYSAGGAMTIGRAGARPIHIRGRGCDRVVIKGALNLAGSAEVEIERLTFAETAKVKGGSGVSFVNCTFCGLSVAATKELKVTHALFAGSALRLRDTSGVFLSGNIYANADSPAIVLTGRNDIRYSDYNCYQDGDHCWLVDGKAQPLKELPNGHGRYSMVLKPEIVVEAGLPQLKSAGVFAGRGPQGTSLGKHQEYEEAAPRLSGPFLHSVSDTTANIEWWTSGPTMCKVTWGETPEMEDSAWSLNKHKVSSVSVQTYRFTSFSVRGLKAGRKYYFAVRSVRPVSEGTTIPPPTVTLHAPPLTLATAAKTPQPTTYYVAPDGDNANSGTSRENAWRTVGHAASQVNAGDTVMIGAGTYREMVRLRATGTEEEPITFKAMPGNRVVMDGDGRSLAQAFVVNEKDHIHLDGFYFTNYAGPVIALFGSTDVRITRCFSDGRGPGYAGPLLIVRNSRDVVVRNCVSIDGFGEGIFIANTRDMLIENNVFFRNLIFAFVLHNQPDEKLVMRKNICTDSLPFKSKVPNFAISKLASLVERDNCYYMRLPDERRKMFQFYGEDAYFDRLTRVGLREYQKIVGDTGSLLVNPWFRGTLGMKEGGMTRDRGEDYPVVLSDKLVGKPDLDFPDLFATAPEVVKKGIGLQPDAFKDFWFNKKE